MIGQDTPSPYSVYKIQYHTNVTLSAQYKARETFFFFYVFILNRIYEGRGVKNLLAWLERNTMEMELKNSVLLPGVFGA